MLRAVIKNTRILDGRAFIGMGILGLTMNLSSNLDALRALFLIISLILYVAYAFAINNCFDADTDSVNLVKRRKNPVANGELSFRAGILSAVLMAVAGLSLAAFLGLGELAIYLSMVFLATIYSAPPRLKARPVTDVLSHGVFFGALPFLYGASLDGIMTRQELIMALAITFYSLALELRNHLEDYESDLRAGLRTTPIVIGKTASERFVLIFSCISIGLLLAPLNPAFGAISIMTLGVRVRVLDAIVASLLLMHLLLRVMGV
ncbi:UbiA prenyltransferase family protein [Pyrococcus yayanosii]|uniref:4-hydroxybenzoate octaprenyltransferase n=1 Tax=Pyrococcus yayanosii (strain CH1 / JCM 16557) TaxID=529709 RepID=F8AJB8_PYRYC|nr:UbiA family prenyltransferase [Pyrococcus yayanosii]AEH24565.1 4-hydroxybenzoate octaprenyltransferase [Pyrococcus yayanosii CH1]